MIELKCPAVLSGGWLLCWLRPYWLDWKKMKHEKCWVESILGFSKKKYPLIAGWFHGKSLVKWMMTGALWFKKPPGDAPGFAASDHWCFMCYEWFQEKRTGKKLLFFLLRVSVQLLVSAGGMVWIHHPCCCLFREPLSKNSLTRFFFGQIRRPRWCWSSITRINKLKYQ